MTSHHLPLELVQQIDRAVELIKAGGIVAFPTDTVYGLGADPFNDEAVERVYEVKQRPRHLPLPILLADETQVNAVAASVPEIAWLLIKQFWPGGLTLVLPVASSFHGIVTAGSNKVAVRIPNHIVTLALIRKLGIPLVGTSANISDKPSVLTAEEVKAQLGDGVDMVIDAGRCPGGVESTVVDLTGQVPVILRQGAVPEKDIECVYSEICGEGE